MCSGSDIQIMKLVYCLLITLSACSAFAEPAWWTKQKRDCNLPTSLSYNAWVAQGSPCNSGGGGSYTPPAPTYNYEAERRAQEAAAAERQQEEAERQRAEQERLGKERRVEQERRQREVEFNQNKVHAVNSLKGVGPTGSQLKSAGNIQDNSARAFGLKGIGDTDIKNVQQDRAVRDLGGTDAAWKQLNAAAYLAGLSLKNSSDPVESAYLAEQSARAMNGDPLGVVVPAAAARPHAERSAASATAYQAVTKHIMGELKTRTAELAEKKKQVVESNQKKEAAKKETQVAREQVEKLELESKQPKPLTVAATAPPEADKAKDDALAKAKAALLAAQQSEAETTRAEERAVSEARFSEQKINSTLVGLKDLNANPDLAESMLAKLQPAPTTTPATNPTQ